MAAEIVHAHFIWNVCRESARKCQCSCNIQDIVAMRDAILTSRRSFLALYELDLGTA